MLLRSLPTLPVILMLILLVPTVSRADLVAGWDFSDRPVDGAPIPVPYPPNVTGDGAIVGNGSTNLAVAGDVVAAALPPGFDASDDAGLQAGIRGIRTFRARFGSVYFEGPEYLGLTARGPASLEFEFAPSDPIFGYSVLTFGGMMIPAGTGIESLPFQVSTGEDCATAAAGNGRIRSARYVLEPTDRRFFVWVGQIPTTACVRFDFDGSRVQPFFDNVALTELPEPTADLALPISALSIAAATRRTRFAPPA